MYSRRCRSFGAWSRAIVSMLAITLVPSEAKSEDSAYCRKVRARASSDAALLYAPSVHVQGIKFPENGTFGTGATPGSGYQVRAQLSVAPLDMYKGTRVVRVGEADCNFHEASFAAQERLAQGLDAARLPALRRQRERMIASRQRWQALGTSAEDRFSAHTATLLETDEVRLKVDELERRAERTTAEIAALEARGVRPAGDESLPALVGRAERAAKDLEREASHVRTLDAWHVTATGGLIPQERPVDYYGIVQVGFNFGGFFRNAAETRYLAARDEEIAKASYELAERMRRQREEVRAVADGARRELAAVRRHATTIAAALSALEKSEAPNAPHARAVLELDAILVEAEESYLSSFIVELERGEERGEGRVHGRQ